jgi:hypothetical protein
MHFNDKMWKDGATTLSLTTLSMMTLSMMTLSMMGLFATLIIIDTT